MENSPQKRAQEDLPQEEMGDQVRHMIQPELQRDMAGRGSAKLEMGDTHL